MSLKELESMYLEPAKIQRIAEYQEFVRRVDTIVHVSEDHGHNLYRKLSAIMVELERDKVLFHCLSLKNYLEEKCIGYIGCAIQFRQPMTNLTVILGELIERESLGKDIHMLDRPIYIYLFSVINVFWNESFIENTTTILRAKFPQRCKEWGLNEKEEDGMVCINLNPMIEGYTVVPFGDDITMRVPTHAIEWSMKRAGNSRSLTLCDTIPASVERLAHCTTGSGHDGFLSTIHVLIDWKVNKIIREHAIRYYFRDICSSQSLMYKSKELTGYDNEDDIPVGFKYWISFSMSYLALKTVYGQRRNHRRKEWRDFCACIEKLPQSHLITGAFKKEQA